MSKNVEFKLIKDKVFKKEVDNLIEFIDAILLRREFYIVDLEKDVNDANEVRANLDAIKEISIDNNYANKIITEIETKTIEAEEFLNNYLIQGVRYEKFYDKVKNAYTETNTGYRKYDVDFFEAIIDFAAMNNMTNELSKDEAFIVERLRVKKQLKDENFEGNIEREIEVRIANKLKKVS